MLPSGLIASTCFFIIAFQSLLSLTSFVTASRFAVLDRPLSTTWSRTQCGSPAGSADLLTRWGKDVSAENIPLTAYPRPMMVRKSLSDKGPGRMLETRELRDTGS